MRQLYISKERFNEDFRHVECRNKQIKLYKIIHLFILFSKDGNPDYFWYSFILKPGFTCAFNITQSFIGFCENSIIQYSVFELPSFCVSYSITSFFLSFSTQVLLISFFGRFTMYAYSQKEAPYRLLSDCFRTINCQKKIIQRCDCLYTFFFYNMYKRPMYKKSD